MVNRVGGLAADADAAWLDAELAVLADVRAVADRLAAWLGADPLRSCSPGPRRSPPSSSPRTG